MDNPRFLRPNIILQARYKILAVLGAGDDSTVYQARDLNFPDGYKLVALKEIHSLPTEPPLYNSSLRAFQREVNILASFSHPVIPKVYDFFDQNGRTYLVMEYINGSNLDFILKKRPAELTIALITKWAIVLCDVLDYLHTRPHPYIFRALKPLHIMVNQIGGIFLIDFALRQRLVSALGQTKTTGIDRYDAPESIENNFTPLTDIYSLGATLHHLLTRLDPRLKHPFNVYKRPMRDFNPQVSDALEQIVMKALAFNPAERYQSAAEMKAVLEAL
jgi:serine/threonine protein kinase